MSSTPQDGPPWGSTQQGGRPGEWSGTGAEQGPEPEQLDFGSTPSAGIPGQQPGAFPGQGQGAGPNQQWGSQPGQQWDNRPGYMSPVNESETRVTGRRVVQYLIDAFLVSFVPSLVSIPFDRSNSTFLHIMGGVVFFVLFVLIGLWYWVFRPHSHNGQTFGMQLLSLRVISKDGGPATIAQLFVRWICLIFDAIPYTWPFTGLVGFVVILCSRHRQRIGDHLARTLVISTYMLGGTGGGRMASPGAGQQQPYESPRKM